MPQWQTSPLSNKLQMGSKTYKKNKIENYLHCNETINMSLKIRIDLILGNRSMYNNIRLLQMRRVWNQEERHRQT